MKLFGHDLFNREPKVMWDFAQFGLIRIPNNTYFEMSTGVVQKSAEEPKKEKVHITPKGLYEMSALNDNMFTIQTSEEYLVKAIDSCKQKLSLMPEEPKRKNRGGLFNEPQQFIGAVGHGRNEIKSVIERLENRRKIKTWIDMLGKYPHTTNKLLQAVLKDHKHLSFQKAEAFVPDFPKEATKAMEEYNKACQKLCGKKTEFYVVSNEKDFQEKNDRRDPILLAQSPFGFFWQILGAWDEEMVYLDEL
jgi:hypothetical protein